MSEDSPRVTPTKVCGQCAATLPPPHVAARPRRYCSGACRHAAYDAAHREERRVYGAAYRAAHREETRAYNAAYHAAHREEERARVAAWAAAHREEVNARTAAYHAAHPEQNRAHTRNRRARLRCAPGTHTAADVAAQYLRQHGRCYWCGAKVAKEYHVDHVFPVTKGGSNGPDNLVVTCPTCNLSKAARLPHEFSDRLC